MGDLVPLVRTGRRPWPTAPSPAGDRLRVEADLAGTATLKDVVESLGVPHCEVGSVIGDLDGLDRPVGDGCRAVVNPVTPFALQDPRFLCDRHLGRLARLLRMLGFDTLHDPDWTEAEVARRCLVGKRTVLSGHRALLKRRTLDRAMLIREDDPFLQAEAVILRFGLAGRAKLFGRCSHCNGEIVPVAKSDVADRIPPLTSAWLDEYRRCTGCGKLYWEGTHTRKLGPRLADMLRRCGERINPPPPA